MSTLLKSHLDPKNLFSWKNFRLKTCRGRPCKVAYKLHVPLNNVYSVVCIVIFCFNNRKSWFPFCSSLSTLWFLHKVLLQWSKGENSRSCYSFFEYHSMVGLWRNLCDFAHYCAKYNFKTPFNAKDDAKGHIFQCYRNTKLDGFLDIIRIITVTSPKEGVWDLVFNSKISWTSQTFFVALELKLGWMAVPLFVCLCLKRRQRLMSLYSRTISITISHLGFLLASSQMKTNKNKSTVERPLNRTFSNNFHDLFPGKFLGKLDALKTFQLESSKGF